MAQGDGKLTVSVSRAAELLGISVPHAWRMVWDGQIPSFRLGKRVLISRREIERLCDGETAPAGGKG